MLQYGERERERERKKDEEIKLLNSGKEEDDKRRC